MNDESAPAPLIIDLGKQKKKKIKQLRRGEGVLLDDVEGALEQLRAVGTVGADAQPVFIIVREKQKNPWGFKF